MKLSLESLSSFELKETLRPTTPRVLDELLLLLVLVLVLVVRSKEMLADVDGAMLLQFEFGFEFEYQETMDCILVLPCLVLSCLVVAD